VVGADAVHEDRLSSVLSEFARTLGTDFPIQRILDHLAERIVGVLSVTGAGVTRISAGKTPQYVPASDEAALRFEKLQTDLSEAPCVEAFESGEAVVVRDLCRRQAFPGVRPAGRGGRHGGSFPSPSDTASVEWGPWTSTETL
jgi:hypothetical protein